MNYIALAHFNARVSHPFVNHSSTRSLSLLLSVSVCMCHDKYFYLAHAYLKFTIDTFLQWKLYISGHRCVFRLTVWFYPSRILSIKFHCCTSRVLILCSSFICSLNIHSLNLKMIVVIVSIVRTHKQWIEKMNTWNNGKMETLSFLNDFSVTKIAMPSSIWRGMKRVVSAIENEMWIKGAWQTSPQDKMHKYLRSTNTTRVKLHFYCVDGNDVRYELCDLPPSHHNLLNSIVLCLHLSAYCKVDDFLSLVLLISIVHCCFWINGKVHSQRE